MKNETVIQQLIETVDRFPDREVFKEKKFGRWEGITWQGLYEEIMLLGRPYFCKGEFFEENGFLMGVPPG